MSRDNQEAPYMGLLGLDRIDPRLKIVNFVFTLIIGVVLAFQAWFDELNPIYHFEPFAWTLLFLSPWPLCAIILWLRIMGLRWRWGILAAILILIIYFVISAILLWISLWMMA